VKPFVAALLVVAAMSGSLFLGGTISAHPVGSADEPNCHGQRVSHGVSHSLKHLGHGHPDSEFPGGTPPERRDIVEEFIGEITVGEWHQFIKTCPTPPPH
jgi:hypothetical protein